MRLRPNQDFDQALLARIAFARAFIGSAARERSMARRIRVDGLFPGWSTLANRTIPGVHLSLTAASASPIHFQESCPRGQKGRIAGSHSCNIIIIELN
jgi:hypothetical protein